MTKKLLLFLVFLLIPSICAISDIQIIPEHPKVGDTITLTGKANPNEEINCQAWFEVNPIVSPPYYGYIMNSVEIPTTPNNFKVIGENVNKLYVSVKMGIWITKSANADANGVAVISQSNVPVGTYDIKIGGTIKNQSKPVKLKIIASTIIKADENGHFKYTYKANNIPPGTVIHLNIGGIKKDILIESDIPKPPINTTKNNESQMIKVIYSNEKNFDTITNNRENNHNIEILKSNCNENNTSKIVTVNKDNNIDEISNNEENNNNKLNRQLLNTTNTNNKNNNILKSAINNIRNIMPKENIVKGTIIKSVNNATLIIHNGTKITKYGEIQIKEITIPNITLAYYITPNGAEFSIPLTLKVKLQKSQNKKIQVLYYDENVNSWINVPYTIDKEGNIVIKVNKAGYYAINEETINNTKNQKPMYLQIFNLIKIVINVILQKILSIF